MKHLIIVTAFLMALTTQMAKAQQYTHKLANNNENSIEFSLSRSEISIEGYDGSEVIIRNKDYKAPPERAKGLRPLYGAGQDNTGIGLSVEESNGILKIVQASVSDGEFEVKVPNNVRVMIEEVNWGGGDIRVRDHEGEIEIKSKTGDIDLQNITGPVIASSTSGNVDVTFSGVSDENPTSISVVSGYIDVTMPASSKADLRLNSISGEIYTNLDLDLKANKDDLKLLGGGRKVESTLNGGGVAMDLKTISGDIYLRKAE
jgi:hypothetical protein